MLIIGIEQFSFEDKHVVLGELGKVGLRGAIFAERSEALAERTIVDALQIGIGAQRDFLDVLSGGGSNLITEGFNREGT